jgi:hypothetical protein
MIRHIAPCPPAGLRPGPTPSFSVVIPAYQAAPVVADAVESALSQTRPPIEVIVVNDGSTDDVHAALARFGDRIRVIDQANGGEASAKNAGIRAATGDFVAILDADDVFMPGRLERLGALASQRPDLDLLTSDSYLVVHGERVRRCYTSDFVFPTSDQRTAILRYNFLPFAAARRTALLEADGFDEALRSVPDWDLWLRMILGGAGAGMVDEPLAEYRLGPNTITSDRTRVHRGKLETLMKARRRGDISEAERRIVEDGIRHEESALAVSTARDALRGDTSGARRACIRLIGARGVGARARLNAAAGIVAPRAARRVLEHREAVHGVETTAGLKVKPPT